jgi:TfoX/Sxy family transcriptional regulator of competence genes
VAYDERLAERVRDLVAGERGIGEKRMFGGLAFLIDGNMAVAVSSQGGLLVRVGPDAFDDALARKGASPMEMRGRPMTGWVRVVPDVVTRKPQLESWVKRGIGFARTLPAK